MKVIATAYICKPDVGSEAGIGWNWAHQIAQRHELWLFTRKKHQALCEEGVRKLGLSESWKIIGYDLPPPLTWAKSRLRSIMFYYYFWHQGVAKEALKLHGTINADIAHHLTFATSWLPTFLHELSIPTVWGPVGRHPQIPPFLLEKKDHKTRIREAIRERLIRTIETFEPNLKRCIQNTYILSLNTAFRDSLPAERRGHYHYFPAMGSELVDYPKRKERDRLEVLSAGRFVPMKGFHLSIKAIAKAHQKGVKIRLTILGDGKQRKQLESLAQNLGVGDLVEFRGFLPRHEVLQAMRSADVFLFPSTEGAGMVVAEALMNGMPVVCLDFGGPGDIITPEIGRAVPVITQEQVVKDLGTALEFLATDRPRLQKMSKAAHRYALNYLTWQSKGELLDWLYPHLLSQKNEMAI